MSHMFIMHWRSNKWVVQNGSQPILIHEVVIEYTLHCFHFIFLLGTLSTFYFCGCLIVWLCSQLYVIKYCYAWIFSRKQLTSTKMERQGINVMMAVLLLAGQMAGVGVINLPNSMIGTGPAGFFLIIYFTINAIFVGQRLGLCWIMVERMFSEYRHEVCSLKIATYLW